MKKTALSIAIIVAFIMMGSCKKTTQTEHSNQNNFITELNKSFDKTIEDYNANKSNNLSRRDGAPSNPDNYLDSVGYFHNTHIKVIIGSVSPEPSLSDLFNAYRNAPLTLYGERQIIPDYTSFLNYIDEGKKELYIIDGSKVTINASAYINPAATQKANDALVAFFSKESTINDYSLRRALCISTEEKILTSGLDSQSTSEILGAISLFKWSDYYWNNEYNGPLDYTKPSPAFWDVLWVKFNGPTCDSYGANQYGSQCWIDVINGSASFSSIFSHGSAI